MSLSRILPRGESAARLLLLAQVLVALVALVLAMVGYARDAGGTVTDDLYRSVALFAGDTTTLGSEPASVTVARWLALAVTLSAVVTVTLAVLGRSASGFLVRWRAKGHVVVAGDGPDAMRIAAGMVAGGRRVVSISPGQETPVGVAAHIQGDPAAVRTLRAARADRAAEVVVSMQDDGTTTHVALVAAGLATRGRVIGLLHDPVARAHLQERILGRGGHVVELLALPEIGARAAVARLARSLPPPSAAVIIGSGPLAEALAIEVARVGEPGAPPIRLHVAGFGAERLADSEPLMARVVIEFLADSSPRAVGGAVRAGAGGARYYLCPPSSVADALVLADAGGPEARVLLLLDGSSADIARAAAATLEEIGDERVQVMDVNAGVHGPALLSFGMIEEIARAKHAQYLRDALATEDLGSAPAMRPWDELDADLQRSNRDFARGVAEHLEQAGLRLVPDPTLGPDDDVPPVFSEDQIESLARAEHDRWMRDRKAAGWVFGTPRNDGLKHHPDMQSWEALDEPTRDKDRQPMRDMGRILAAAGLRAAPVRAD